MNKWLFWALLGLVAWLLFQSWAKKKHLAARQREQAANAANAANSPSPSARPALDKIVTCAHCGLHLPQTEARQQSGAWFCGDEHARLGRRSADS